MYIACFASVPFPRVYSCCPCQYIPHLHSWCSGDLSDAVHSRRAPLQCVHHLVDLRRTDDEDHADAVVERARHLERRDVPVFHQEAKDGRQLPRRRVDVAPERLGEHARDVLREAAARDVRHALEQPALRDGEHLRDVDLRRREQSTAERHVGLPRARRGVRDARDGEDLAHEREAVRV